MSTATETKALSIRDRLESPDFAASIAQILPKHMTPERMVRVAIAAITRTPLLRECEQSSFFLALMNLSQWGLEPDGRRAHLIPFRNNKRGVVECQLIIDYKGLVELAMRSGTVSRIHSDVVCDEDIFVYDRGELKAHKIDFRRPRGNVFAVYALIQMKDGSEKVEVMSRDEVEAIRKRSKAGNSGPWVTDWNEMARKTVFRRASKWLQLSAELAAAVYADDDRSDVIDSVPVARRTLDDLAGVLTHQHAESGNAWQVRSDTPETTETTSPVGEYLGRIQESNRKELIEKVLALAIDDSALSEEDVQRILAAGNDRLAVVSAPAAKK